MAQKEYIIEISLENKPAARDPVAETIKRDLLAKKGYDEVSKVRSGQYLRINILAVTMAIIFFFIPSISPPPSVI